MRSRGFWRMFGQRLKVFEIGKDSPATIEAFMQQYKKGFSLDSLKVVAQ